MPKLIFLYHLRKTKGYHKLISKSWLTQKKSIVLVIELCRLLWLTQMVEWIISMQLFKEMLVGLVILNIRFMVALSDFFPCRESQRILMTLIWKQYSWLVTGEHLITWSHLTVKKAGKHNANREPCVFFLNRNGKWIVAGEAVSVPVLI